MKRIFTFLIGSLAWCSIVGQTGFSIAEYKSFLQDVENLSYAGLSSLQPISNAYYSGIDNDDFLISDYQFLDSITDKYGLTDQEFELLEENHFVVTERLSFPSMGQAFADIFHKDLPVFVSTDAILHAMHKSYDEILQDIERQFLEPNLVEISDRLYDSFNELESIYQGSADTLLLQALKDVDLYVTITQSLIQDALVSSNDNEQSNVSEVWEAIMAEKYTEMALFTWNKRKLDFSQFKPRGHYKDNEKISMDGVKSLEPYFRSMMWLGRMD
ncbi:MAG: DUF3160 domain-containing protein, partial [Bacteroidota bacterium]